MDNLPPEFGFAPCHPSLLIMSFLYSLTATPPGSASLQGPGELHSSGPAILCQGPRLVHLLRRKMFLHLAQGTCIRVDLPTLSNVDVAPWLANLPSSKLEAAQAATENGGPPHEASPPAECGAANAPSVVPPWRAKPRPSSLTKSTPLSTENLIKLSQTYRHGQDAL
jgi:hypothetical protein